MLSIGQWKKDLLVRWGVSGTGAQARYREIRAADTLNSGKARFVTVTSDEKGSAIYFEGRLVKRLANIGMLPGRMKLTDLWVRVGNSSDAKGPWFGELFGLAFYDRALKGEEVLGGFHWWMQGDSAGKSPQKGKIAVYTFNERSGGEVHSTVGSPNALVIPLRLVFEKKFFAPLEISRLTQVFESTDMMINKNRTKD